MRSPLEPVFQVAYAAYKVLFGAFRLADLNLSVVWAAVGYGCDAALKLVLILLVEFHGLRGIRQCLAPPECGAWFDWVGTYVPAVAGFVRACPLISAFLLFVASQTWAIHLAFTTAHGLMTFKLTYLLGSDQYGRKGAYSPFDDASSEASDPSDPLAF